MALVTYDPFRGIRTLQDEMNQLFDRHWDDDEGAVGSAWPLRVNIKETEDTLELYADLPGMKLEDITVGVEDNQLTIAGERKFSAGEKREDYHRVECRYGRFTRTFHLPNTINLEQISADYEQGVLKVILPKREETKPRQINVKVHG